MIVWFGQPVSDVAASLVCVGLKQSAMRLPIFAGVVLTLEMLLELLCRSQSDSCDETYWCGFELVIDHSDCGLDGRDWDTLGSGTSGESRVQMEGANLRQSKRLKALTSRYEEQGCAAPVCSPPLCNITSATLSPSLSVYAKGVLEA